MSASDAYTVRPSEIRGMTDAGRKSLGAWIARVAASDRRTACHCAPVTFPGPVTQDVLPGLEAVDAVRVALPRVIVADAGHRNTLEYGDKCHAESYQREIADKLAVRLVEAQGWELVTPARSATPDRTVVRWQGGEATLRTVAADDGSRNAATTRAALDKVLAVMTRPAKAARTVARKARTVVPVAVAAPVAHRTVTRDVHATPRTSAWLALVARLAA